MRLSVLALIVGVLFPFRASAATTLTGHEEAGSARSIVGTITDPIGGSIVGASVQVTCGPVSRATVSATDGTFAIEALPQARCALRIEENSFAPKRMSVDLSRDNARLTVVLDLRGLATFVAVTPSRTAEEELSRVPAHTTVLGADEIRARAHQILPQALAEEPGIVVQQTTAAQGAPVIRGVIGYQNVALIDGVRLNTSAWRSGPVQYLAWYDPSLVDRVEVMRGPTSVLYGSDALGGTIHVRSIQPTFSATGIRVSGAADLSASSSDSGRGADARVEVSGPRAGLIAGGGYDRFDDIRPGKGTDSHAAVTRFLGLPSAVLGSSRMRDTGYEQRFGHVAAALGLGASTRVDSSYHYDEQTKASRYDRIHGGDGLFRSEFGPQRLDVLLVKVERGRTKFLDGVVASFSLNRQADGRIEQARPMANVDAQENATTSIGYQFQGARSVRRHRLTVGVEVYDDYISGARTITSMSGAVMTGRPDIPDGTRYTSFGAFAQDIFEVVPERLSLRGGMRYGAFDFRTRAQPALGVLDESVSSDAMTFQAGGVLKVTNTISIAASGGRGFRAPNASDLGVIGVTSVFEVAPSRAAALGALMGATDGAAAASTGRRVEPLRPEHAYSYEASVRYHGGRFSGSVTGYSTEMRDAIQRRTIIFDRDMTGTSIAGFDVVRQDAVGRAFIATSSSPMVTRVNVSRARLRGVEADARVRISGTWLASTYFSYGHGTDIDANVPLRRVPPGVGGVRVRWEPASRVVWVEGLGAFMTRYSRMAPGDLTDARLGARRTTQSIASYFNGAAVDLGLVRNGILMATGETLAEVQQRVLGGTSAGDMFSEIPGHFVATVRGGYRINTRVELTIIGENLADVNYRTLGSGIDAPGRSVRVHTLLRF